MLAVKASPSEKSESHTWTRSAKILSGQVYDEPVGAFRLKAFIIAGRRFDTGRYAQCPPT